MNRENEKLTEAKLKDVFIIAKKNREVRVTDFLDPAEQQMAEEIARSYPDMEYYFDGGHAEAERKLLVAFVHEFQDEHIRVPIGALRITSNDPNEYPSHRDYLGSILGLGISREKIGDILVINNSADVIVKEEVLSYIGLNLIKVGNTSVSVEEISLKEVLQPERRYKELASTVASLRLDAIASIAYGISRSKIVPYIKGENVKLNFKVVKDPKAEVNEGDIISASRLGRAKVVEIGGQSKKGRTFVKIHRYIS
jgi:RNA-binding protein YlmH